MSKLLKGHIKNFAPEQLEGLPEIIPISGGKDSTALALIMREKYPDKEFKYFCCSSGELSTQKSYLDKIEELLEAKIYRLFSEKPFEYYVLKHPRSSGKRKGVLGYGWPSIKSWFCGRVLKESPVNRWLQEKFPNTSRILHIGIGADEPKRANYNSSQPLITSHPLVNMNITTAECKLYLQKRNLLNPAYKFFSRFSCFFCPQKSLQDLYMLYKYFPKYWEYILWLDKEVLKQCDHAFKPNYTAAQLDSIFRRELF